MSNLRGLGAMVAAGVISLTFAGHPGSAGATVLPPALIRFSATPPPTAPADARNSFNAIFGPVVTMSLKPIINGVPFAGDVTHYEVTGDGFELNPADPNFSHSSCVTGPSGYACAKGNPKVFAPPGYSQVTIAFAGVATATKFSQGIPERGSAVLLATLLLTVLLLLCSQRQRCSVHALAIGAFFATTLISPQASQAAVERVKFPSAGSYLILEFLNDDLVHFELSPLGPGPDVSRLLVTTPQVSKADYLGPTAFTSSGNTLETPHIKIEVDRASLCFTQTDKLKNLVLTTICPLNLSQARKGLTLAPGTMQHVYGLGEQFIQPGNSNGDWTASGHLQRTSSDNFGNQMTEFDNGATGNAQIPVLYAIGPDSANYALFLDQLYKQSWDFSGNSWNVEMFGDQIRGYLMSGPDLPGLRRAYMELTGRPPVPPKKMFGLWVSQYGYRSWDEVEGKLSSLRANKFPIEGFVLDLQWFGGVPATGTNPSKMGSLTFDPAHFPNAAEKLATYKAKEGIGIMAIEESYVDQSLPEYTDLRNRQFLLKLCQNGPNNTCDASAACVTCEPVSLGPDWFGTVGMIDWANDAAADYWRDLKRQPLIKTGLAGHWLDLGEPERYNASDWTVGIIPDKHAHADYHNLYTLKWAQSVAQGYSRNGIDRRPFMMARSGAAGIQRFGASMWSGDIASKLTSLASHFNVQMHMSMSGIDYFGADIGGFRRQGMSSEELNDLYTRWFANGMMFDVPGRPHTENLDNSKETAPDRIGDLASNLANLRERYELSPYTYSLAYRAYLFGEPVVPPPVYYYQSDMNLRRTGDEKMLGHDLLIAAVFVPGASETRRDVYLPAGDWVNYHTNQWFHSAGQDFAGQPEYLNGLFRLPTYVRAGALLPKMYVDDKTMNILGQRTDGSIRDELVARVYASATPSAFRLYEDDGQTIAYQSGAYRTTDLSQQLQFPGETVVIGAASGNSYTGAPVRRNNLIELVAENVEATIVTLNGPICNNSSARQRTTAQVPAGSMRETT